MVEGTGPSFSKNGKSIYFQAKAQIWRVPAEGGEPIAVAGPTANFPVESDDATLVYYRRGPNLYAKPVAGGDEREVVKDIPPNGVQFVPVSDGLYYVARTGPMAREVRFLRTGSTTPETLYRFEVRAAYGLTVSPDRKTFLYSGQLRGAGDDLMLIRNFH